MSPGFTPRPWLSGSHRCGRRLHRSRVAGVYAPALVERSRLSIAFGVAGVYAPALVERSRSSARILVHPVNGEVPPVKGRPWKLPHYANRGKTSSSRGELASARSCFSTVRTALGKLRITGLLARFDVARSFPQFPRPLLLQPTIWTSERGADLGSGRCQPRPHLPIYRMTPNISLIRLQGKAAETGAFGELPETCCPALSLRPSPR